MKTFSEEERMSDNERHQAVKESTKAYLIRSITDEYERLTKPNRFTYGIILDKLAEKFHFLTRDEIKKIITEYSTKRK